MLRKKIRVNDPLVYKGTRIYQASYGVNPAFLFDIGGEKVTLSQGSTFQKEKLLIMVVKFENSVHNFGPGLQIAYLEGGEPKIAWFLKDVPRLKERNILGVNMRLEEIKEDFYTGLEVAYDPGVWVVWTAFALILFGLYVNFFVSYRRLYLLKTPEGVRVAGLPGKNREAFREEFEKLKEKLNAVKP
jgi:cytochrome c biogenesis protein